MSALIYHTATSNAFSTSLNGSIDNAVTTITLSSVTSLQSPGVLVIDRQDGSGNNTPTKREFITFTGISGSDLTGVTRGVAGSTAQSHSSGALVEETFSTTHWESLGDLVRVEHTSTGTHVLSAPTIANPRMITSIQASGASLVASTPLNPLWVIPGFASGATTSAGLVLRMPRIGNWDSFWMSTRTPVSTASLTINVMKNGTTVFNTIGRLNILGGGTFASTASILTKAFVKGDEFSVDIVNGGNVADITVQGLAVL